MSAGGPSKWERHVQYRRSVMCPKPCGYVGLETREEGARRIIGSCTKCGHFWSAPYNAHDRSEDDG